MFIGHVHIFYVILYNIMLSIGFNTLSAQSIQN